MDVSRLGMSSQVYVDPNTFWTEKLIQLGNLAHVCGAVYMCLCNAMHENLMVFGFKTDAT